MIELIVLVIVGVVATAGLWMYLRHARQARADWVGVRPGISPSRRDAADDVRSSGPAAQLATPAGREAHAIDGEEEPARAQFTKVLATLGPSTDSEEVIERMVQGGATMFRLNFSHGTFEEHGARLRMVRSVSQRLGISLAVLGDLPGPKLRIGDVAGDGIELTTGEDVLIDPRIDVAQERDGCISLPTNYPNIAREVEAGHRVLINDGHIRMLAVGGEGEALRCRVTTGGRVTSKKGLNLPDSELSVPSITKRDWEIVAWAIKHDLDFLALSFVRHARDVQALHAKMRETATVEQIGTGLVTENGPPMIPIIAKIETPQGVAHIEEIAAEADAIMVARGDLGVEMDLATVPMVQKRLIKVAHRFGKPCIVATQMLESMITSRTATRAEVSDVANAILDHADVVMLSGETAAGKHPIMAVEMMRRVALATEEALKEEVHEPRIATLDREQRKLIPALTHGAWHMARDIGADLIVVWSENGGTARYLSRNGFRVPVLAFSSNERAVRRMNILNGIIPVHMPEVPEHRSDFAGLVDRYVMEHRLVQAGDTMVLLGGKPLNEPGSTNTVAIRVAGRMSRTQSPDDTIIA